MERVPKIGDGTVSQRKAVHFFGQYIYALRYRGCSWNQVMELLVKAGISLKLTTVRSYYSETLATNKDAFHAWMTHQDLLMAPKRKAIQELEDLAFVETVREELSKQPAMSLKTSALIDSVFGCGATGKEHKQVMFQTLHKNDL